MPITYEDDAKTRRDPYNPRTGATGDDAEPGEGDRTDGRASPGSGEENGPADIQPDDVEKGTAR